MTFQTLWDSIPAPVRTIVNVVIGAGFAAGLDYVIAHVSGGALDLNALGKVVLVACGTALVRALNPVDTTYGIGSSDVAPLPQGTNDVPQDGVPSA